MLGMDDHSYFINYFAIMAILRPRLRYLILIFPYNTLLSAILEWQDDRGRTEQ